MAVKIRQKKEPPQLKEPPRQEESIQATEKAQREEEVKQLLRDGATVADCAERFSLSERQVYRYLEKVRMEEPNQADQGEERPTKGEERPTKARTVTPGTPQQLAVITTKSPGPIVFRMGNQVIDLEPADIYDAWRYCQDIKVMDPSVDDSFSHMLKVASKNLWDFFSQREARRVGAKLELVEDGGKQ